MRSRAGTLAAGAMLLAGAAGAQEPLTSPRWRPPPRQVCRPSPEPRTLPALSSLVDSAGLSAVLAGGSSDSVGYVVLSAQYDVEGALTRMAVVETDVPDARAERVALGVATLGEPQRPAPAPWSVRLRVRLGPSPALRVERSEFCPAATLPQYRHRPLQAFRQLVAQSQTAPVTGEALVLRSIDERGAVAVADVLDVAGTPPVLRVLAPDVLRAEVFMPALLDRRPAMQVDTLVFSVEYTVQGNLPDGPPHFGQPNKIWRYRVRPTRPR